MKICAQALFVTLSLALLSPAMTGAARADKYDDQKSGRVLAAEQAQREAQELAHTRAEIKKDVALSCDQIADEVVRLDRVIREARTTQIDSRNAGTGVSVAKTVGSLLVGSLGGVVGIVAVGALAGEAAENSGEKAALSEEKAEERQNRLAGIFDGKGCEGELALTSEAEPAQGDHHPARIEPATGTTAAQAPLRKPRYNE